MGNCRLLLNFDWLCYFMEFEKHVKFRKVFVSCYFSSSELSFFFFFFLTGMTDVFLNRLVFDKLPIWITWEDQREEIKDTHKSQNLKLCLEAQLIICLRLLVAQDNW